MPRVGMLCWGATATPSVRHFVVTTNVTAWKGLKPLGTWARAARKHGLNGDYIQQITTLSDRLVDHGGFNGTALNGLDLRNAWRAAINANPPNNPDTALRATWTRICNADLPPARRPHFFNRPRVSTALAFDCRLRPPPRERCVRCRVLFRFNMSDQEPLSYRGGPYKNRLSCAEVDAYEKCRLYGL